MMQRAKTVSDGLEVVVADHNDPLRIRLEPGNAKTVGLGLWKRAASVELQYAVHPLGLPAF